MEEIELFAAFSAWMRFEIDKQTSSSTEDLLEKEALMDHAKILAYIQRYLVASPMAVFLEQAQKSDYESDGATILGAQNLLDLLDGTLKQREMGAPYMKAFPQVKFLIDYLSDRASVMFRDIAEAEKRMVRLGPSTKIESDGPIGKLDVRMCPSPNVCDDLVYHRNLGFVLTTYRRVQMH